MASVHCSARSPFWFCAYTLPDGRRVTKTTKTTIKRDAEKVCNELQKASNAARSGNLTEAKARQAIADIVEATGRSTLNAQTVEQFFQGWLDGRAKRTASATARRYRDALKPFFQSLGSRSQRPVTNLQSEDIERFLDESRGMGLATKTVNFRLKTIRAVLKKAHAIGIVSGNVAMGVDMLRGQSGVKEEFSEEQLRKLLGAADDEWKGVILLGAAAGLRLGDAAKLCWENVYLNENLIRLHVEKTRFIKPAPLEILLLPDVQTYLTERAKSSKRTGPIFPLLAKKKGTGSTGLSNTFTRLMARAGVERKASLVRRGTKGRSFYPLSFHSTRHTYITLMAKHGVSREIRMKLAGHASAAVHEGYTHGEIRELARRLKGFPCLLT